MYDYRIYAIVAAAIMLDIISGLLQAGVNHSLSSEKLRAGAYHKMGYVVTIALALLLEYSTYHLDLGFTAPLTAPVCAYIVITEAVSVFENITRINPDLKESPIFKLLGQNQNRRKDDER